MNFVLPAASVVSSLHTKLLYATGMLKYGASAGGHRVL